MNNIIVGLLATIVALLAIIAVEPARHLATHINVWIVVVFALALATVLEVRRSGSPHA